MKNAMFPYKIWQGDIEFPELQNNVMALISGLDITEKALIPFENYKKQNSVEIKIYIISSCYY